MKKVGDLFQELGFNEKGSDQVKIAFIKNLVRAAYGVELAGPKQAPQQSVKTTTPIMKSESPKKLEQLSFDIDAALKKAN